MKTCIVDSSGSFDHPLDQNFSSSEDPAEDGWRDLFQFFAPSLSGAGFLYKTGNTNPHVIPVSLCDERLMLERLG